MRFPLPDELTESTFTFLDAPSLLRCMQVCKLFHSIISRSTQLTYKIELSLSCMVDNEHSSMDTISRLNALREHNRVWNDMTWPSYGSIPMCNGNFWEFSGGILAQSTLENEFFFVQLPCKPKGIPERRWTIPFDFGIHEFTFDSSQDLIVLLELTGTFPDEIYVLHLRTLSGERHPQATVSQIQHALGNSQIGFFFSFVIQICGAYLAVLFHGGINAQNSLLVWNWKTGQQEMHIDMPELRSFAFMTEDLILAAVLRSDWEPTLQVLRVGTQDRPVYSLKDAPCICELHYPALQGNADGFLIRSDPLPASKPPADSKVPFYCSRKDTIFTISMRIHSDEMRENIVLFVPLSTFLSEVERSHGVPRHSVAWDAWGPSGTRMVCRKPSNIWVSYTYGTKYIQLQHKDRNMARLHDFNPYATRMHVKTSTDSLTLWKPLPKLSKPSSRCESFDREVTTMLPGRVASVTLEAEGCEAAMLGESHILMVQLKSSTYGFMAM